MTADHLAALFPGARTLFALDFYVDGAEGWTQHDHGWEHLNGDGQRLVNIDHHAADPTYYRAISSGILAMRFVEAHGPVAATGDTVIAINHCDNPARPRCAGSLCLHR